MTKFRYAAMLLVMFFLTLPTVAAQELMLRDALANALRNNPELIQFPYQQRVADAAKLQAALKPNPHVGLELENMLGTGSKMGLEEVQATLSFSQLIELGDKRKHRIALADAKAKRLAAEYHYAKIEVLAETTARFYQVVELQQIVLWQQQQQQRLAAAERLAEQRFASGAAPAGEVLRIALAQKRLHASRLETEGRLKEANARLSAMWAAMPDFERVAGEFDTPLSVPSALQLDIAVDEAPEMLRLFESERVLTAKLAALQAGATADLTLGGGLRYNAASDDFGLVVQASMPWQLSNPQAGNLVANKAEREGLLQQQRVVREHLRAQAKTLQARASTDLNYLRDIQNELLPLARELEQTVRDGYQDSIYSLLQVIDAQQELAQLEYEQIQRRSAIYQSLLQLERLTGQSFVEASQ